MQIKTSLGINSPLYHESLAIREAVFVNEQHVPTTLEIDADEDKARYFVGYADNGRPVATARVLPVAKNGWHIQRVAVIKSKRHLGLGQELLEFIEKAARSHHITSLQLGAQAQARGFYEKLGYHVLSEDTFMDAGIPHYAMEKDLI
ncbi:hypothetical protein IV38_GL001411 [Lactobacillus selangorensis]|uniref:N-acetyltransferase domain-containing protein n=1 Tax=Lactobacillus selangorensis TaxID=81857 RepID=A0A0R2FL19_9LACO|nr:GNAT family N-acetyltransferase [Lactobacillus selangorensis]KRN28411.1 hypothetical protein IV38_GL001411 [Lactobacillus selangorensis]KRN31912.1 hypothetical protein IV40_GL001198 [Lactobacillus selangorensis]